MNKLLYYYQKELNFIKQHSKLFASRFPKIARRLGFVEGESEDPHVSRLIESFALLTSRIHLRMDEDMPELVEAILYTIAPQFLHPFPSCCIVMLEPDRKRSGLTGKNIIPANTSVFHRQSEQSCQFQTAYKIALLPLSISSAKINFDKDLLSWKLNLCFHVWQGATILNDSIRIFLHGPSNITSVIYTFLCAEVKKITLNQSHRKIELSERAITPVGFEAEESLLNRTPKISMAHILLLDYFTFPQKFSFIDVHLPEDFSASNGDLFEFEIVFKQCALTGKLEKLAAFINENTFRLHCSPAVNLFPIRATPIAFTDAIAEYPIVPASRNPSQFEVWSINHVTTQQNINNQVRHLSVNPLMENNLHDLSNNASGLYWQSFRREAVGPKGIENSLFIAFSKNPNREPITVPEIISLEVMCTNHIIPSQMQYGNPEGDFDTDVSVAALKISALTHPTKIIYPPDKSDVRWRFLSQLSLNHQLLEGKEGAQKLKEMLAIYNFDNNPGNTRLINLIHSLRYNPITTRIIINDPHSLARGLDLTVQFSHEALQDPEYYMFCSLLDHLLALYAPVNSFIRLTTIIENEAQTRRTWPVRAGRLSWL